MSYAISSTKRKFHRALDSLTNGSTTSLVSLQGNNASEDAASGTVEPPGKKSRVAADNSPKIPRSTTAPALQNVTNASKPRASPKAKAEQATPNYAPWSREQFLERLETFRDTIRWDTKPDDINEVKWAKQGWRCVGDDRVGCVGGCGHEVVVMMKPLKMSSNPDKDETMEEPTGEDEWNDEIEKALTEKYARQIVSGHDENCLWRRRGCDGELPETTIFV